MIGGDWILAITLPIGLALAIGALMLFVRRLWKEGWSFAALRQFARRFWESISGIG